MDSLNYSIEDIAVYIMDNVQQFGDVDFWKLQKLLYFAQGFVMGKMHKKLFNNKPVASQVGPIFTELQYIYNNLFDVKYGGFTITDEDVKYVLDDVIQRMGELPTYQLEQLSYQDEPWIKTENGEYMEDDVMHEYFSTFFD